METGEQVVGTEFAETGPNRVILNFRDSLATIYLGEESERVVILTEARMESLAAALAEVKAEPGIKGLVILGSTPGLYCAGADVNVIRACDSPAVGERLSRRGQEIFSLLESLPFPTVAAISGACVGGGCEFALACKWRVMTDIPESRIGLPETKLGIIPGFGGTQRLPRLVGLPRALDIILRGQVVPAKRAFEIGLVDKLVVPPSSETSAEKLWETLRNVATDIALGKIHPRRNGISLRDRLLTYTGPGRNLVRKNAMKSVLKETRGNYPAPPKAIDCAISGLQNGRAVGYHDEVTALGQLITTPECKSLVHLYFLTEDSSKLGRAVKVDSKELSVLVVGGGVMGAGIASAFLGSGARVTIVEPHEPARKRGREQIEEGLQKRRSLSSGKRSELLSQLRIVEDIGIAGGAHTLVIEAIVEDIAVKKKLFQDLEKIVSDRTILATNTSSLSVSELAAVVSAPERVVGMHFFNPAEKMPLVEIIQGAKTNDRTIVYAAALASKLGKYPVIVGDVPGFLVNRILSPYLVEAAALLQEGYTIQEIDSAAVAFGMPMGPLRLLDEVGLDVASKVSRRMEESYGARMAGPQFAETLLKAGRLGKKNGSGFYRYEGDQATLDDSVPGFLGIRLGEQAKGKGSAENITDRLILALINEAVRCLDEQVAGQPGREAACQIDLGSVMGFGFAPFRGGVLNYAERRTPRVILEKLMELKLQAGERFTPWEGIISRAERSGSFYASAAALKS